MASPVLFIGSGFDGPVEKAVELYTIEDALNTFGGYIYDSAVLAATDSTITLSDNLSGSIAFFEWDEYSMLPYYDIAVVGVTGNIVEIDPLGEAKSLVVKYQRPIERGDTTIYKAVAEAFAYQGENSKIIKAVRLGGTTSSMTLGSGYPIVVTSEDCGALYNSCSGSVSGTTLTISFPPGKFQSREYELDGLSSYGIVDLINLDNDKGYSCVYATSASDGVPTLSEGTTAFSGGSDGTIDSSTISTFLESTNLSDVASIYVAGSVYDFTNGAAASGITDFITADFIEEFDFPSMLVVGARCDEVLSSSALATRLIDNLPITSSLVTIPVGDTSYSINGMPTYNDSIAPVYALMLGYSPNGVVLENTGITYVTTEFTAQELVDLKDAGYANVADTVSRGFVVVSDNTTDPNIDSVCYIAYAVTYSLVMSYLNEAVLGRMNVKTSIVRSDVIRLLSSLPQLLNFDVTVWQEFDTLYVDILIVPLGKISAIHFTIPIGL